jgi:hypothetical protein
MATSLPIQDSRELGQVFRAARKVQHLRQDEVGRFSHSFIGEVEAGKPTAQIGKVLEALRELGLKVHIELPPGIDLQAFEKAMAARR